MPEWNQIDKEKTANIIRAVSKAREGTLFSPETSGAQVAKLPFYRNYHLYRLTNFSTLPAYSFDYLGDGKRFYYLDGSAKALANVSAKNELFINEDNVLDYIDFYFRQTHSNDGEIKLIRDLHDHPGLNSMPEEKLQNVIKRHKEATASFSEDEKKYYITATLDHNGTLVQADVAVTPQGLVSITNQKMLLTNNAGE